MLPSNIVIDFRYRFLKKGLFNMRRFLLLGFTSLIVFYCIPSNADLSLTLNTDEMEKADAMYQQYCSLCHGKNREGYKADHAPSLKSKSMLSTAYPQLLFDSISWGRVNSAMDGYSQDAGGPLTDSDIILLIRWLAQKENVSPIELEQVSIKGDSSKGKALYASNCSSCHGQQGQGVTAPAIADQLFLSSATDSYIKYAIVHGRVDTPMQGFKHLLGDEEINDLVAYLRSQASGWKPAPVELAEWPSPDEYVVNPREAEPTFNLREGRYVPAMEVVKAIEEKKRMIVLDTRPGSAWQRIHIPGAVPMPYYRDKSRIAENLPNDGTWIVAYCACPHAASDSVVDHLRSLGYENTAVIDEGILKWIEMSLPVVAGKDKTGSVKRENN
ncbi:c-type cytochrome [Alteromonas sp. S015]|uniref:c-type cytochrome n=1 Tax=Alteromonas sp. S015 TaxID=3117401 RepID=UPI002FE35D63